jgi:hypothetical protein
MTERGLSELAVAIAEWGIRTGATDLHLHPGVWSGEADPLDDYGTLEVKVNAHSDTIDNIPPFNFVVVPKDNPLAFVVMVNPYGGSMIGGYQGLEDRLIEHFNSLASGRDTP